MQEVQGPGWWCRSQQTESRGWGAGRGQERDGVGARESLGLETGPVPTVAVVLLRQAERKQSCIGMMRPLSHLFANSASCKNKELGWPIMQTWGSPAWGSPDDGSGMPPAEHAIGRVLLLWPFSKDKSYFSHTVAVRDHCITTRE